MKYLLRGSRRQASFGLGLVLIAAVAACSSTSSPMTPVSEGPSDGSMATSVDAGGGGSGDDGGGLVGTGAACPAMTDAWVGALLKLDVTWLPVIAANLGSGTIYIWHLYHFTFNGTAITGTVRTCGDQVPPLALNATGRMAINAPTSAGTVDVLDEVPTTKTWDGDTRTAPMAGTLGAWNVGSSFVINTATTAAGLAPTSTFSGSSTTWPPAATSFQTSDLSDDDHDGNPGITAFPVDKNSMGFYLPATSLGGASGNGSMPTQVADQIFIVKRTQFALHGTSTSCSEITGTATVPEYVVHVVGCHDHGTAASASCTANEWQFIDENATIYAGSGGSKSTITGTFDAKQVTAADGGEPGCDDVVALFPSPMPQPQP
jgi:hypothetical protein